MNCLWTIWQQMAGMFPGKWVRENGTAPVTNDGAFTAAGETWRQALVGTSPKLIATGLAACLRSALEWPPNPGRFRAMCLGIPAMAEVEHEMRPYSDQSGFTLLVRSKLDLHAYGCADGSRQQRILADAYERAVMHVMDGGAVPAPAAALPSPKPEPHVVRDRDAARSAMAHAAAELGFGGVHGAG